MHDRNGTLLNVGDEVLVPAIITHLSPGEEYCNVTIKTVTGRRPDKAPETISAINTGVLVKYANAAVAVLLLLFTFSMADASDKKARGRSAWAWAASQQVSAVTVQTETTETIKPPVYGTTSNPEALGEVNEARSKRGLPALIHDVLLSKAAHKAAQLRASRGIAGHLPESDFTCLPAGASADAAGCAALDPSWGWQSCAWDDPQYTHAGAAWVLGTDGKRYMHIFVRREATTTKTTTVEPVQQTGEIIYSSGSCSTGQCGVQSSRSFSRSRRGR